MANRHFGKLADVWKHLPLAEILSIERPQRYWETHAGNAQYAFIDDPERRYGAAQFVRVAGGRPRLARSRYRAHLRAINPPAGAMGSYPGSPLLAMLERGRECAYLLCDTDPASGENLRQSATELGLASCTQVVVGDGMTALHQALAATPAPGRVLAHVDPYDPRAAGPSGLSALDLARELIDHGVGLMYWYGYDRPGRRAWAFEELAPSATAQTIWCGDTMVVAARDGGTRDDGDLGEATTPGTGFGIVCANVSDRSLAACQRLGQEIAEAYAGTALPDGSSGRLDFLRLQTQ